MSAVDAAKIWSLNYRVLLSVISRAEDEICSLGLESKELFLLAEIDEHPSPAADRDRAQSRRGRHVGGVRGVHQASRAAHRRAAEGTKKPARKNHLTVISRHASSPR